MTEWLVDHDWHYHHYPLDEPEETFPAFADVLALWREKGGGRLPAWSDFDFLDFEGWWGWLSVYDVIDLNEPRFEVRLWGTRIADFAEYDLTGATLSPANVESHVDATSITLNDLRFSAFVAGERRIGYTHGPLKIEYGQKRIYHEVHLPLSGDDGSVDKILFAGRIERRS